MAVIGYALDETEPLLSGVPLSVFTLIRPTLDSGRNKARNRMNKCGTRSDQTENKVKTNQEQTCKEREKEVESEREVEVESEKESKNDSYTPPTPSATDGAAKNYWGFDQFWDVYPKKSAKKDAFDAWKRVDPDEVLVKRILEAVKQQKLWPQYSGENARYFPSPSKWLNGGCWDDEPSTGEEDPYAKFT
jgi:hypothetical protein|nr:MAG TPA: putative replisome organizer protein [Caudoviricetes sp.]